MLIEPEVDENRIHYLTDPVAEQFHGSDDFVRGLMSALGMGKTTTCVMELLIRASRQMPWRGVRRTRWLVIRNTAPELKSTTIRTFREWIPDSICKFKWDIPIRAKLECTPEDGIGIEAEFIFLALDREDDVKKLKSFEATGAWLNEASEINKSVFDMITGRIGRYPPKNKGGCSWRGIIMDTNPPDDDHWYYSMAEVQKPQVKMSTGEVLRYSFFRYPPPLIKTDSGFLPNPKAKAYAEKHILGFDYWLQQIPNKSDLWINVFIMGNYGSTQEGRPVYPEWNDSVHAAKEFLEPLRGLPIYLGWDFGLTPAVVICQVSPRGQLMVIDELCSHDQGIREFSRDVVRPHISNNYKGMLVHSWGDPSGTQRSQQTAELTCMLELQNAGFPTEPAFTNDFLTRREAVAGFLNKMVDGEPGFLLSPKCDILRKGFNGRYKYERVRVVGDQRFKDKPNKDQFSHPHDALQYVCMGLEQQLSSPRSRARPIVKPNMAAWT